MAERRDSRVACGSGYGDPPFDARWVEVAAAGSSRGQCLGRSFGHSIAVFCERLARSGQMFRVMVAIASR
jgi:hypothetical protein